MVLFKLEYVAFNPCHYSGDVVESAIEVGEGVKKLASLESLKGRKYQKADCLSSFPAVNTVVLARFL